MTDVHQFFILLKRYNLTRQQAFRAVSDDLAYQVDNHALSQILFAAKDAQNEIMVFVGNRGCVQILPVKSNAWNGWSSMPNGLISLIRISRCI